MTKNLRTLTRGKRELPMKRYLMLITALPSMKKIAFTFLCCILLMLSAAPARADVLASPCAGALFSGEGPATLGSATDCGALINVTAVDEMGKATAFTVTNLGNGNPYDATQTSAGEDTLIGIQNNSSGTLTSITLSSAVTAFGFDGDGPCDFGKANYGGSTQDCFGGQFGYEGPNNTFSNISNNKMSGTVNFFTPCDGECDPTPGIGSGVSTWFALEGPPQAFAGESHTLTFTPGTNVQQQATDNCGATTNTGACTNPDASSIKLTFDTVTSQFQVQVTFTEVDGNGSCVIPSSGNANDSTDFDCTWANFFGNSKPTYGSGPPFTAPFFFSSGTAVNVPYCLHYGHGGTKCVDINAELLNNAAPGNQFSGSIGLYVAWNEPTTSLFPPTGGPWGSDNTVSPRFYDAPHDDSDTADYAYPIPTGYPYSPSDQQKVFDITGYFNPLGQAGVDGGIGTTKPAGGKTLNHFAVAFPLAPPDTAELLFPLQKKPDPACFIKGLPMPVLFEIENTNTDKFDPNALKAPNYARITVLQGTIPVLAPVLGQILPVPLLQLYAAALSNANLTTSTSNATTLYQLQIQSNLAAKPLTKNFVVKKSCP